MKSCDVDWISFVNVQGVVNLIVEENVCRAAPGGTGGIKAINNYSSVSI